MAEATQRFTRPQELDAWLAQHPRTRILLVRHTGTDITVTYQL